MRLLIATVVLTRDVVAELPCSMIEYVDVGAWPALYAAQYTVPPPLAPDAEFSFTEMSADVLFMAVAILLKVGGGDRGTRVTVRMRYALMLLLRPLQPYAFPAMGPQGSRVINA